MIIDEEIQTAINKLKKGKASDNSGIRADDVKTCDDATKRNDETHIQRSLRARKLHSRNMAQNFDESYPQKKRNEEYVGNDRPICILPTLYEMFSTIFYNRFLS